MKTNKIFLQNKFKFQKKEWEKDIGYDVKAISEPNIIGSKFSENIYKSIDYIEYNTGIKIDTIQKNGEEDIYTLVYARSSISNKNLVLANSVGLIDPDYRNDILIRFKYIPQPEDFVFRNEQIFIKINFDKIYNINDKICQFVFCRKINVELNYVEELIETNRGGFGSTGN
jgi:dUTPase